METVQVNTTQHIGIDYPVAGIAERIAARLIDLSMFVLGLLVIFLSGIFNAFSGQNNLTIAILAIFYGAFVFYNLLCEIFMGGQSIGKRLMKIKVISLDGGRPTLGQYLLRWLFRLVDFWLTAQIGGLISVALTEKKQRIGDIVAGTTLIRTVKRTGMEQIAFLPVETSDYAPVFEQQVRQLGDRDIELIHEVISTYSTTNNTDILYATAAKLSSSFGMNPPEGMNELDFLKTVIKDYSHITATGFAV